MSAHFYFLEEKDVTAKERFKKYCRLCDIYIDKLQTESLILVNIDVMETQASVANKLTDKKRSLSDRKTKTDFFKKNKLHNELKAVQKELTDLADAIQRETIVSDRLKPLGRSKEELTVLFNTLYFVKTHLSNVNYTEEEIFDLCDLHYERIKREE